MPVDVLAAEPPDPSATLRADILVDRHWWCLDRAAEAQQAVTGLAQDHSSSALAALLGAQLRYTRALFGTQFDFHPDPGRYLCWPRRPSGRPPPMRPCAARPTAA